MYKLGVCSVIGAIAIVTSAVAADWPQYCGPTRDNVSTETGLADAWPASGPNVLWETAVSAGYSGPAIKDGKVYLIDRDGGDSLLRCLDMKSGKELWKCAFADPGEMAGKKYEGTRGIPTISGDAAYLVTGCGLFACIDLATQTVKWRHSLTKDYGTALHQFGIAQSPFIHGDMVLVAPNAADAGVAAYDKTSGKRLWVSPCLGDHAYVTPQVVNLCGREMVVAVGSMEKKRRERGRPTDGDKDNDAATLKQGHVAGLALDDGSILWDYTGWQCEGAIPFPMPFDGDRLFITGGYNAGSAMIRIVKDGSGFAVKELYKTDEVESQLHQPIRVGKHLFIGSNTNNRKDGLAAFDYEAGKRVWRTKDIEGAPNFERGSLILADGKLVILDGKTGILHLVKADPSKYTELAAAKMVKENDMAWAPLALSDGRLLVRDWTTLKCINLK